MKNNYIHPVIDIVVLPGVRTDLTVTTSAADPDRENLGRRRGMSDMNDDEDWMSVARFSL